MEKFLGVLFCGGRGTRLKEITKYISKSFVPVYDQPVFTYGLKILEQSKNIDEIIFLTNDENDEKLKSLGYKTLIQDDSIVFDMFSGWDFIKQTINTKKHGVLVPSDNITDVNVDTLINKFKEKESNLVISLFNVKNKKKLSEMGCYDPVKKEYFYKHKNPPTSLGVIAPYIVRNSLNTLSGDKILNDKNIETVEHNGYWFDIGDPESIIEANNFIYNFKRKNV